ncbi:transporter substrate-binding domain-containing protein [Aquella oligotrophica]|uniref:Cyclohexadienyl dehydratase n=1 Tax=Aquella oligotrophica TaxID=2067065 RepID=A0A2I7N860_9NEIS|nr:transporter substrate-binding domain-containing protein [Aquella oligotrophica]AUR52646.1 cyclohexadienyl dehydratase [Aquella oligotrophica]
MRKIIDQIIIVIIGYLFFIRISFAATTILVGTTGDYPPLSAKTESGFVGKDIDIIKNFAADNHLDLRFVTTSWQNLSDDLSSGKFILAVGGISENPERSKLFYLSIPIESSAKVPMIRCSDRVKYSRFALIDNESVIVSENRGGTNQDFALKNIKHAVIRLTPKNDIAIASLTMTPPLADVMFTDSIEADYRHHVNHNLCLADIPEKFPGSPKVFIFAKTEVGRKLQQLFNQWWLNQQKNSSF